MGGKGIPRREGHRPQRLLPARIGSFPDVDTTEDVVRHRVEERVLALDVAVERRRRDAELRGQTPKRKRLEPVLVRDAERHFDDQLTIKASPCPFRLPEGLQILLKLGWRHAQLVGEAVDEGAAGAGSPVRRDTA